MRVPQKWRYALRAVFELACRSGRGHVKVAEIAEAQGIPPRFLEVILNQLKREGIVESRRGNEGGYVLVRPAHSLSVGEVIRSLDGQVDKVRSRKSVERPDSDSNGDTAFLMLAVWEKAWQAMWKIYDSTTFQDLLDDAERHRKGYVPSYHI